MAEEASSLPLVSVILLNWNGIEDTKVCLEHLRSQTYPNYEIIVVDNGSTDTSVKELLKISSIKLVINKTNRGFTGGHIDGLKEASGDFILILNNDAVMKPDVIEKAMLNFDDESVAVVGGRAYFWNKHNPLLDEDNAFYAYQIVHPISAEAIFYQKDYGVAEEVNNVSGSCALIRKSVIDKFGYLDDRFFAYYEEADLFARYKRAGYKIIYDPAVRIWHKVGASSKKKSSSFMYYMLFRNRFFFAVHNFETGYLLKFLFSYAKFGIKSILKSILNRGDQDINKPFARAFCYNLFHFPASFMRRAQLTQSIGESHFNSQLQIEQSNVSHVLTIKNRSQLDTAVESARKLRPSHELVLVISKDLSDPDKAFPPNIRLIHDRQYFDTHPENIGAIVSRYDWLSFTNLGTLSHHNYAATVDESIASLLNLNKSGILFSDKVPIDEDFTVDTIFEAQSTHPFIIKRTLFLEAYGLPRELSLSQAISALAVYCHIAKQLHTSKNILDDIPRQHHSALSEQERHTLVALQRNRFKTVSQQQKSTKYEEIFKRFYRLQQFRALLHWILSPDISPRLKVARSRNLIKWTLLFDRKRLATELKHIRNEIWLANGTVRNLDSQKAKEGQSHSSLSQHPDDTPVFIICRDRLTPLLQLVKWLEGVGFKRIVFIDNDSVYPDLVEYLTKTPYQTLQMKRNAGHTVPWQQSIIPILVPEEYYIVTDPDVIPDAQPSPQIISHFYDIHKQFPHHLKVGFGLKINDLPDHYSLKESVIKWERQFWQREMDKGVYEAGVDTTFALYKPFTYDYIIHPSLRLGEPYVARHLPWYSNDSQLSDEDIFYRIHADQNVNTWNKGALPERYLKELAKLEKRR